MQASVDLSGVMPGATAHPASLAGTFTVTVERCEDRSSGRPGTGPGALDYRLSSLQGQPMEGTLTYASLLQGHPKLGDTLVFRTTPVQGCDPGPPYSQRCEHSGWSFPRHRKLV